MKSVIILGVAAGAGNDTLRTYVASAYLFYSYLSLFNGFDIWRQCNGQNCCDYIALLCSELR